MSDSFRTNISPARISRNIAVPTAVVGTTLGASGALDMRGASGGQLIVPAGPASQVLTAYVSSEVAGTFVPLIDSTGAAVTITAVQSKAYDLPESLFATHFLKLVAASTAFTGTFALKG